MTLVALLGSKALWLTYSWLASAILASLISDRKGYGEKPGLASGLLLSFVGLVVWLLWPAKDDSRWKLQGPIPRRGAKTVAQARAERDGGAEGSGGGGGAGSGEGGGAGGGGGSGGGGGGEGPRRGPGS